MFKNSCTYFINKLQKSFIGSLVIAVGILVGLADHDSDSYTANAIIKTAEADTPHGGGGGGGGCAGCGGASGGCASGGCDGGCNG